MKLQLYLKNRFIYIHCNLSSMTMTYSGKPSDDVRCDCAFNAIVCMKFSHQTLAVGVSKVEVMILCIQYPKHIIMSMV